MSLKGYQSRIIGRNGLQPIRTVVGTSAIRPQTRVDIMDRAQMPNPAWCVIYVRRPNESPEGTAEKGLLISGVPAGTQASLMQIFTDRPDTVRSQILSILCMPRTAAREEYINSQYLQKWNWIDIKIQGIDDVLMRPKPCKRRVVL